MGQQISLYYLVLLCHKNQIQIDGVFKAFDELCNERIDLDFCWIPLTQLDRIKLYPSGVKQDM